MKSRLALGFLVALALVLAAPSVGDLCQICYEDMCLNVLPEWGYQTCKARDLKCIDLGSDPTGLPDYWCYQVCTQSNPCVTDGGDPSDLPL